mmetsp:Transcript_47801/g.152518  ORF Transcript_47801/g.152518 Transcript_47801/m.152518 type:complete len:205 (-) Transcript_47801:389-1003(-)
MWSCKRWSALLRFGRQPARSCGALRMVPSPLQGTSQSTRSKPPPKGGSDRALWWITSPAGCRTRSTWWASMQHRRPSSSLATTAPARSTASALSVAGSAAPASSAPEADSGRAAATASRSCSVFMPGEAQVSSTRRPAPPCSRAAGTMETASCLEIAPSSTQRFKKPCSRLGPGALRSTTLGRSRRHAPSSQGSRLRGCAPAHG